MEPKENKPKEEKNEEKKNKKVERNETEEEKAARRKAEKEAKKKAKEEKKKANQEEGKEKKWESKKGKGKEPKEASTKGDVDYYVSKAKLVRPNKGKIVEVDNNIKDNILITSALPYVNNVPHLGNIIGCVLSADVFARFSRLMGKNVLYVCGTDEYGTATETKALAEHCTPQQLCDKYHQLHEKIYEWFDIDFDYFGRTTTPIHSDITHEIFTSLQKNNHIKKMEIEQFRCENCNLTLSDRYILGTCYHGDCKYPEARGDQCDKCGKLCNALELIDPKCKLCGNSPVKFKSHHYFLNLPDVEDKLKEWVAKTSEEGSWSQNSKSITNGFIAEGLKERCITRDLKWGVNVPSDDPDMKNKVFYVWFDAPIGYLSITANFVGKDKWKTWWQNPEHVKLYQFMGKDNVTFHTVIFPTTLMGTDSNYTLLHHLSTTEYLNYENTKFSKTKGVGVFGDMAESTEIDSEVWRYYLLAVRPETADTDFKWDDFLARNNNELLANLGNLCNRILVFDEKNFKGKIPSFHEEKLEQVDKEFMTAMVEKFQEYVKLLSNTEIRSGVKVFMEISSLANGYLQTTQPWNLMKKNKENYDIERAETIVYILNATLRFIAALGEPFMPSFSAKIYEIMNIKYDEAAAKILGTLYDYVLNNPNEKNLFLIKNNIIVEGQVINKSKPLFKNIPEERGNTMKEQFSGSQNKKEEPKEPTK